MITDEMEDAKHLVDQGIEALLTGERARARELLQRALKQDPRNEQGWLALSFVVDKPEHALECVQRVLALNPGHEKAQERLADLQVSIAKFVTSQAQPVLQPPVLQNPAEPARWITESDALRATGEYFYFEPAAERYVRGETSTLPGGREGCILLFLIPFVLAGLVILGLSVREWVRTIALKTNSAETWGTLADREKDDSGDSTNYYVTYRFVVDDQVYVIDESVGSGTFNSVDEGEPLRVRYALHNPNIASIERVGVFRPLMVSGCSVIWCVVVSVLVSVHLRIVCKRRRLAQGGSLIDGEIVHCSGYKDSDNDFHLKAEVRFRSPQTGKWLRKRYSPMRNDLKGKPLPRPGTLVHLLYLDDKTYEAL